VGSRKRPLQTRAATNTLSVHPRLQLRAES
jgi:hypothetical protein